MLERDGHRKVAVFCIKVGKVEIIIHNKVGKVENKVYNKVGKIKGR